MFAETIITCRVHFREITLTNLTVLTLALTGRVETDRRIFLVDYYPVVVRLYRQTTGILHLNITVNIHYTPLSSRI